MNETTTAVTAAGIPAAVTLIGFVVGAIVARGSALSKDQRARRAALREAKRLVYGSGDGKSSDGFEVIRVAEFILRDRPPNGGEN